MQHSLLTIRRTNGLTDSLSLRAAQAAGSPMDRGQRARKVPGRASWAWCVVLRELLLVVMHPGTAPALPPTAQSSPLCLPACPAACLPRLPASLSVLPILSCLPCLSWLSLARHLALFLATLLLGRMNERIISRYPPPISLRADCLRRACRAPSAVVRVGKQVPLCAPRNPHTSQPQGSVAEQQRDSQAASRPGGASGA